MPDFRCAAASLARDEPVVGTASTVRAFLLVENDGPWGLDALRDARMPEPVRDGLRSRAAAAGVRVLLVRRHRRARSAPGLRVFAAWADAHEPWLESATLAEPEVLLDLDLAALGRGRSPGLLRTDEPVFAVCTHGRHDACCATFGRPTAAALARSHPDHAWEVSHVGGDRFAANVLVLPEGLYYGRVTPEAAPDLARRHLEGHLDLDRLRGRSGFGFAVQAAEVALRRHVGVTRTDAVRHVSTTAGGDPGELDVRLAVEGQAYDVRVRRTLGDQTLRLTCRAHREGPVPEVEVVSVRLVEPDPMRLRRGPAATE